MIMRDTHDIGTPIANREPVDGKNSLRLLPWCGKINLRGDPHNAEFMRAAGGVLQLTLPDKADAVAVGQRGMPIVFRLGPDEWLVHCELDEAETLRNQLAQSLARIHHSATEVSDYYAVLELQGEDAAAILARGCPLDLAERNFPAGQCAQTRFGNASVLLYRPPPPRDAPPTFLIQTRWSFTEYVWDYLTQAIGFV